jgi:hypothetical protein
MSVPTSKSIINDKWATEFPEDVVVHRRAPTAAEIRELLVSAEHLWQATSHHMFFAIDLEFTRNKFALIQMCFDSGRGADRRRTVYITNAEFPGLVDLIISPHLVKLLHGSETNDVPWLLEQIPVDKRHMLFINFVDTRFVAEYLTPDKPAGLYKALLRYQIITEDEVQRLLAVEKSLGHIQHVDWRLHKISNAAVKYAIEDVLHLRSIYSHARRLDKTIPQFRNVLRICFLQRFLDILDKEEVDRTNNYYIVNGAGRMTLNDLGTAVLSRLRIEDLDLARVSRIGWVRPPFQAFVRRIVYAYAIDKYDVMIDRKTRFTSIMEPIPNYGKYKWMSLDSLVLAIRTAAKTIVDDIVAGMQKSGTREA